MLTLLRNFFSGELARFHITVDTSTKTRSSRPPRLDVKAIIDAVGERKYHCF
jgi:hypothetical protein